MTHKQLALQAKANGKTAFTPEKPCNHGHDSQRFTNPPYACIACHAVNTQRTRVLKKLTGELGLDGW